MDSFCPQLLLTSALFGLMFNLLWLAIEPPCPGNLDGSRGLYMVSAHPRHEAAAGEYDSQLRRKEQDTSLLETDALPYRRAAAVKKKMERADLRIFRQTPGIKAEIGGGESRMPFKKARRIAVADDRKFLMPILYGNQGPNNQLQCIKLSAVIAANLNRTFVLAPLFNHISTIDYRDLRQFNETLDADEFSKLLPTATMEEYRSACGRVDQFIDGVKMMGFSGKFYRNLLAMMNGTLTEFGQITGIKVPDVFQKDVLVPYPDNLPAGYLPLKNAFRFPGLFESNSKCLAIVYPYGLLGKFYYYDYKPILSEYVVRPPYVKQLAKDFIGMAMGNQRYLSVHWRFNEDWKKQWCYDRPGFITGMAKHLCKQIRDVSRDRILDVFRRLMNIHGATAVYLATPLPYHSDFVRGLQSSMPNFFTLEHLLAMKNSRLMGLDEDNYKASLVEQEICKESTVFLGLSTHSSWSGMVAEDRNDRDVYEITTEFGLATD